MTYNQDKARAKAFALFVVCEIKRQKRSIKEAGFSKWNFWDWQNRSEPRFSSINAVLRLLGYKLSIVPVDAPDILDRRLHSLRTYLSDRDSHFNKEPHMPEQKYQIVLTEAQLNSLKAVLNSEDLENLGDVEELDLENVEEIATDLQNGNYIILDPEI